MKYYERFKSHIFTISALTCDYGSARPKPELLATPPPAASFLRHEFKKLSVSSFMMMSELHRPGELVSARSFFTITVLFSSSLMISSHP